jgi:hypothetical protein
MLKAQARTGWGVGFILRLANKFGLLTTAPEPLDLWRQEIRILRHLTLAKLHKAHGEIQ